MEAVHAAAQPSLAPTFQSRVDAVFGALSGPASQPAASSERWALTDQHVFRPGKAEGDSSDEEEGEGEGSRPAELLPGSELDLEADEEDESGLRASTAFCRALDKEEEYDEVDAVATRTLAPASRQQDQRPDPATEVLDESIFEQRYRQQQARQHREAAALLPLADQGFEGPSAMDCDGSRAAPADGRQPAAAAGEQNVASKRVRFSGDQPVWVPPHRRDDQAGQAVRSGGGVLPPSRAGGRGASHVPDHVRNPHKYTCYVLDEPLLVGSGGGDSGPGAQRDMEQAARAAGSAAQAAGRPAAQQAGTPEEAQQLPEFGSGIQFRPRQRSEGGVSERTAAQQPLAHGGPAATFAAPDSAEADAATDEQDAGAASSLQASAAPLRRRQFRAAKAAAVDS